VESRESFPPKESKMKKLLTVALLALVCADLSAREPLRVPAGGQELALAAEPTLLLPAAESQGTPVPYAEYVVEQPVRVLELYQNVKVRDRRNIHPGAVSKIVSIPNPCDKCCRVNVEICVPPCANEKVRCYREGDRLRFCYGKYSVDVISRRFDVVVDYND
jgi:hypothetical protein